MSSTALTRARSLATALCLITVPSVGCKRAQDPDMTQPPHDHGDHDHGDHGHHGHGEGAEDNGHGYKGHRFEDPQAWMEHFESPERTAWQKPDEVVASLKLGADATIADIGAGTGYFAVRFAAAAAQGRVFAVDIEPGMVAFLDERAAKDGLANLEAVQGEPNDPKLPASVDLVFMCNVFHHLADPVAYFQAVAARLEPGARVVIVDFRKDNPEDAPGPPAAMRMTPEDIAARMREAGYELVREDLELLEYQYVLEFKAS